MGIYYFILLAVSVTLTAENIPKCCVWSEGRCPYEGASIQTPFEVKTDSFSFNSKLKIEIRSTYPMFHSKSMLFLKINEQLQNQAQQVFIGYIEQFKEKELL